VTVVDDSLSRWPDISGHLRAQDVGLLLGNGASQAVWPQFSYRSLYDLSCAPGHAASLGAEEQEIFSEMGTTNFENVLWALATTSMVCRVLRKPYEDVSDHYQRIRRSLIHAVHGVHVPFTRLTETVKSRIRRYFTHYDYIYTTNYDLLVYWSLMNDEMQFKDFLWYNRFDPSDSFAWGPYTKVLFLHGALHLYHNVAGETVKKTNTEEHGDILSQFYADERLIPLFVSEGTSEDKVKSIRRNDYLSFAYWKLAYHRGPMVVFGNSLSAQFDQHILDAMRNWYRYDRSRSTHLPARRVAISMHPGMDRTAIIGEKNRLMAALPHCELFFFDSSTHPLGDQSMTLLETV
jgi:hypothetical protein